MAFVTKSRYHLGGECPTKIHYSANRAYHNKNPTVLFCSPSSPEASKSANSRST